MDLDGDIDRIVDSTPQADSRGLSLLGWIDDRQLLVARTDFNPDWTDRIELWSVDLHGLTQSIGTVDRAFVGTVSLTVDRRAVLLTRIEGDGTHNIYRFDLQDARLLPLTHNLSQGTSFSGITPLGDGAILFVQHERHESIWYVRIDNPS